MSVIPSTASGLPLLLHRASAILQSHGTGTEWPRQWQCKITMTPSEFCGTLASEVCTQDVDKSDSGALRRLDHVCGTPIELGLQDSSHLPEQPCSFLFERQGPVPANELSHLKA